MEEKLNIGKVVLVKRHCDNCKQTRYWTYTLIAKLGEKVKVKVCCNYCSTRHKIEAYEYWTMDRWYGVQSCLDFR